MENNFNKINELIAQSKNILIASHRSPDEDAVGSALALRLALKNQGIESTVFIADYSPKEYKYLPGYNLIESQLDSDDFDLVFALDYGHVRRLSLDNLFKKNPTVITFDHHLDEGAGHIGDIKILKPFSSTSEIIYYYLKESGWPIDRDIATCILTGIIGDTAGFIHANTSHQVLRIVGELLSCGIQINKIIRQILSTRSIANKSQIFGQLLGRITKYPEMDFVYLTVGHSDFESWHRSDMDNLVSTMNVVDDCKWAMLLVEYEKGKTKASLRSEEYKGVDVSKIASLFGGGGHKLASGFRVNKEPEKVLREVIQKTKKMFV